MFRLTSDQFATGVLFVVIGFLACLAPVQNDTWWLLRAGRDTWETHAIVLRDTYSHTGAGLFWPNHEWLTEVFLYGLYQGGGFPLVTAAWASLIVAAWALSWKLTDGPFELKFLLFGISLVSAAASWAIRPHVVSMAMFAVTCWLLRNGRVAWLPLLLLIWTNLHAGVVLGLVAVLAALAVQLAQRLKPAPDAGVPWLAIASAAGCVAATFVSPLGWRLWSFLPPAFVRARNNQLVEWMPPDWSPVFWPFWILVAALTIGVTVRRKHLDERGWTLVAIALAMLPFAVRSMRNVGFFLLIAVPALGAVLSGKRVARRIVTAGEHERLNAALFVTSCLVCIFLVSSAWRTPKATLGWHPMSAEAAAAIAQCDEPIYNTYGDGGVLIWFVPTKRVFIDSRQDQYPDDLLQANRTAEFTGNFRPLFDQHRVQCAIVPPYSAIARSLERDPGWRRDYSDAQKWAVFARTNGPEN